MRRKSLMSRLDVELEYIRRQSVLEQYRHAAEELSKEVEAGHVEQSVVDMAVNYAKALREEQDRWAYIIALLHKPRFNKKFLKKRENIKKEGYQGIIPR